MNHGVANDAPTRVDLRLAGLELGLHQKQPIAVLVAERCDLELEVVELRSLLDRHAEDAVFRHSFDVSKRAEDGELNRTLVSAARFINMHARAGVEAEHIELAVVVHGTAVHDVSGDASGSADLVAALIERGVKIIVCGQSAAYYDVETGDLLPGVEMALSAMTVHALLQQQGYTLNPF